MVLSFPAVRLTGSSKYTHFGKMCDLTPLECAKPKPSTCLGWPVLFAPSLDFCHVGALGVRPAAFVCMTKRFEKDAGPEMAPRQS